VITYILFLAFAVMIALTVVVAALSFMRKNWLAVIAALVLAVFPWLIVLMFF